MSACAALSPVDFAATRTSFFPSIRETLDHNLAVDRYYLGALHGEADMEAQWRASPQGVALAVLAPAQAEADMRFIGHVDAIDAGALDETVVMDRGEGRFQRELRGHVIAHLLAHQVHHRGQAHAMLSSTAVTPPQLDEFLMPSEAHLRSSDLGALGWSERTLFG